MSRARAILEGRPLPAPPPVLQKPGERGEPAVDVDGDEPVYVGSHDSFQSGWFGGGMLGGLLMGPMLGGFGAYVIEDIDPDDEESDWER
jgi:predicted lipid-binding transport protein (Tim44 family)